MQFIEKIKLSKPTKNIEWIITISSLAYLSSYLINNTNLNLPFFRAVNFSPIEFTSFSIMCFGLISGSISNYPEWSINSKRIYSFFCGMILISISIFICIFIYFWIPYNLNVNGMTSEQINNLENILHDKKVENKRKNYISTYLAEERFSQNGQATQIIDNDGDIVAYVPTERIMELYKSKQRLLATIPKIKTKIYALLFVLFVSVGCGIILRKKCI